MIGGEALGWVVHTPFGCVGAAGPTQVDWVVAACWAVAIPHGGWTDFAKHYARQVTDAPRDRVWIALRATPG